MSSPQSCLLLDLLPHELIYDLAHYLDYNSLQVFRSTSSTIFHLLPSPTLAHYHALDPPPTPRHLAGPCWGYLACNACLRIFPSSKFSARLRRLLPEDRGNRFCRECGVKDLTEDEEGDRLKYKKGEAWLVNEMCYVRCGDCGRVDEVAYEMDESLCWECFMRDERVRVAEKREQLKEWIVEEIERRREKELLQVWVREVGSELPFYEEHGDA